jgi:hypothetical protein
MKAWTNFATEKIYDLHTWIRENSETIWETSDIIMLITDSQ